MICLALIWHSVFFWLFALVACAFAVAVVATNNIVRMAFFLTISLGATSGLFFLAGSEFIGAMQLLIYVGGTLVLLIFGVMLTAQGPFISMKTSGGEWIAGAILGGTLLLLLLQAAFSVDDWSRARVAADLPSSVVVRDTASVGMGLSGPRVDRTQSPSYVLLFELASVHLLVVLIGAAYMARAKRRSDVEVVAMLAPQAGREFGGLVRFWLGAGILMNLVAASAMLLGVPALPEAMKSHLSGGPSWVLPGLGVGFLLNCLLLLVVGAWQRWGVYALGVVAILQAVALYRGGADLVCLAAFLAAAMVPVVILFALLLPGGKQSAWARMD